MWVTLRRLLGLASFVALLAARGEDPVSPPPAPSAAAAASGRLTAAEEAELAALLAEQSAWQRSLTLRGAAGWRDNILLSSFAPLRRGFARAELEAFLWRPMRDMWEVVSYVNGDVLRYFSPPPETAGEQQWFGHAELRWQPVGPVRLALKADGFFQDAVIDLSETETLREVAPTRTQGGFATLAARFALPQGFAWEPFAQAKRTDYREFPGDYDETIGGGRLEWKRGDAWRISAGWIERARRYAQRVTYTAGGRPLPDTRLRFRQREADVKLTADWNRSGKWTAALGAGWLANRDRASGYFDYDQKRAGLELGWEGASWRVSVDGDVKRMEYRTQTVGAGIAPPARVADAFETVTRIERTIGEAWTLFAEHAWERQRSNEAEFNYRANTVLAGVQRAF